MMPPKYKTAGRVFIGENLNNLCLFWSQNLSLQHIWLSHYHGCKFQLNIEHYWFLSFFLCSRCNNNFTVDSRVFSTVFSDKPMWPIFFVLCFGLDGSHWIHEYMKQSWHHLFQKPLDYDQTHALELVNQPSVVYAYLSLLCCKEAGAWLQPSMARGWVHHGQITSPTHRQPFTHAHLRTIKRHQLPQ